jgi:hypothetical protein
MKISIVPWGAISPRLGNTALIHQFPRWGTEASEGNVSRFWYPDGWPNDHLDTGVLLAFPGPTQTQWSLKTVRRPVLVWKVKPPSLKTLAYNDFFQRDCNNGGLIVPKSKREGGQDRKSQPFWERTIYLFSIGRTSPLVGFNPLPSACNPGSLLSKLITRA